MNAQQARKLTDENLHGQVIAPMLEHVHQNIAAAAKAGRSEIAHPMSGYVPMEWLASESLDALWLALQNEGYTVTHHPDPDPGHPASGPYTTVRW